jgi:hypothetical protein
MHVAQSGQYEFFSVTDGSDYCSHTITYPQSPYYAQAIVEAFSYSAVQQIAQVSEVDFSSAYLISVVNGYNVQRSFNYLYGQNTYNQYTLLQNASVSHNIVVGYSTTNDGPVLTWYNSWYDYNYAQNNP